MISHFHFELRSHECVGFEKKCGLLFFAVVGQPLTFPAGHNSLNPFPQALATDTHPRIFLISTFLGRIDFFHTSLVVFANAPDASLDSPCGGGIAAAGNSLLHPGDPGYQANSGWVVFSIAYACSESGYKMQKLSRSPGARGPWIYHEFLWNLPLGSQDAAKTRQDTLKTLSGRP